MARVWARVRARVRATAARLVFVAVFAAASAFAQSGAQFGSEFGERYALVIGNSDYAHVEDLTNTARDAEAMAEALEALRFTVFKGIDLAAGDFERLIENFAAAAADADTVVFYYAGHGFQLNGLNHLAPVDAVLRDRARIDAETFVLDDIVARIHRRQRQTIVFLDACRNHPLPVSAREGTGPGLTSGLAQVGTGDGIFVAFATQPGNVSYDGTGKNSPFTEALLTHIGKPNRNISSLMIDVRNEVSDRTLGRQVPWDQSSLRADFHFNPRMTGGQQVAAIEPGRGEPGRGGLVIGRPGDGAIRGRGDAAGTVPETALAPRQSPITIGPAPVRPPAVAEPTSPAAQPEMAAAQPETATAPVKPRVRPEQMMAAVTARATPDTVAPATSARATPDTVAPASSARAMPDKIAGLATTSSERPATVTPVPTSRAQAQTTVTRTVALAQPETLSDAVESAPVERLRPDREWFPDDAASSSQEAAETQEFQTAALDPAVPLVSEPEAPREPLVDQQELARSIQGDLARLGCYRMTVDGVWGPGSRNSLAQFYREKGEAAPSLEPSTDVLAKLEDESGTVCAPPQRPKTPQVAAPPQQKKAPARAKAQPAPQRPTASAPSAPAAAAKTPPKILGF
ncbi:MAG TPA: caspase family protein [Aestuariivirgaceae bacterium]|nr:caspase family protein [Aestuariivirgaceae bacterium]